jgi:hypothetical protein
MKEVIRLIKDTKEALFAFAGIITSLLYFAKQFKWLTEAESSFISPSIDALNALVLFIALAIIKPKKIEELHSPEQIKDLVLINQVDYEKIRDRCIRVNMLVKQFVTSLRFFMIILSFYYIIQFVIHLFDVFPNEILNVQIIHDFKECNSFSSLVVSQKEITISYIIVDLLGNLLNLFSSVFLFSCFAVLYLPTIKDNLEEKYEHYLYPSGFAILLILLNILLFSIDIGHSLLITSFYLKLVIGIFAGFGMIILFSRFISMELYFSKSKDWQRRFYQIGILFSLPLYSIVQPLFAFFDVTESIGNQEVFKSGVFLICLWGKIFFILFIYSSIFKGYMHAYLLMVLHNKDYMEKTSLIFTEVNDFIGKNEDKSSVVNTEAEGAGENINPDSIEQQNELPNPDE